MKEEIKTKVAKDFTMLGDPISGSKYFRTFCWTCFEPMRTTMLKINDPIHCEDCGGHPKNDYIDLRDLHSLPNHTEESEVILNEVEQKVRRRF